MCLIHLCTDSLCNTYTKHIIKKVKKVLIHEQGFNTDRQSAVVITSDIPMSF